MFTRVLTALAIVFVVIAGFALASATSKGEDCCAQKLACCKEDSKCCSADEKPGCCEQGLKCCAEDKACCQSAAECCRKGEACCEEAKACCDKQGNGKVAVQDAVGCCLEANTAKCCEVEANQG